VAEDRELSVLCVQRIDTRLLRLRGNHRCIAAPSESLGGGCFCSLDLFSKNVRINYIFDLTGDDIKHIVDSTQDEQDTQNKEQNMSVTETKTLAKIIRQGWKDLATNDQSDGDAMSTIVKEILEALEELEGAE